MNIRYWLHGWSSKQKAETVGILFMVLLLIYVFINVGIGGVEVTGIVINNGIDGSSKMSLPKSVITVSLDGGQKVTVEVPRNNIIMPGTEVVLSKASLLLSPGNTYRFLKEKQQTQ